LLKPEFDYTVETGSVFDCLPTLSSETIYQSLLGNQKKGRIIVRPDIGQTDTCTSVEEQVEGIFRQYEQMFPKGFAEGEYFWKKLLESICTVESNCDNTIISEDRGAFGKYQIRQVFLTDAIEAICQFPHLYGLTKDSPAAIGACAAMEKLKHEDVMNPQTGERLARMLIKIWWIRYFGARQPGETIEKYVERISKKYHGNPDPKKNEEYWQKIKKQFFNPSYPNIFPPPPVNP
jgi:hypothetical protein